MLPSPCYIVSDLHIGIAAPDVERRFVAFTEQVAAAGGSLVVNGDLFDFWFEWRTVIPRTGYRALAALARLRELGLPVLWLAGNHDCWGGEVLREDVGVEFVDQWRGRIAGWDAYVHHGDGLRVVEDRAYRRLRTVLRHPAAIRAFRWIHPDWGSRLAMGSSSASRNHADHGHDEGAGLRRVALDLMAEPGGPELVVFGHSHQTALERAPRGGVYANAGSWLDEPTYLRVTTDGVELRRLGASAGEGECLHVLHRAAQEPLAEP
ncbi:MAG TPA: UDP-2,3-diacylglucosamine diphosphatase [Gemmatimonadaceae bacterium]|nr:UDP-2,3-diacylglucosamine diphosphatase [Gemmatimonadaceae bacterium]